MSQNRHLTTLLCMLAVIVLSGNWAPGATSTLVSAGSTWKYLDNGANLGTAWRTNSFNDGGWASGPAPLGYGEMNVGQWPRTTNGFGPDANNKFITTYYRRAFQVTNAAGVSMLQLRLLRDDGAVVYLNGVEVFRSNMPTGAVTHATLASAAVSTTEETKFFQANMMVTPLREGTNLLAVEVHQAATNSSDLAMNCELTGIALVSTNTSLTAARGTNSLALAWPADAGPFSLHCATNLTMPVTWMRATNASFLTNGSWVAPLRMDTNAQRFFRLQTP